MVVPAWQTPLPSHTRADDSVDPVQPPGTHSVAAGYLRQAPLPSHMPSRLQLEAPSSGHSLSGSMPAGTAEQRPSEPGSLQVEQASLQAVSQQNPSTHDPVWHCVPVAQLLPRVRNGGGPASGVSVVDPPAPPSPLPPVPGLGLGFPEPEQAATSNEPSNAMAGLLDSMAATIYRDIPIRGLRIPPYRF
jgi:hypothetical protein